MQRIRLHGEVDDLTDEEVKAAMDPFRVELQGLAEEKGVGPSCIYNADQTGFVLSETTEFDVCTEK